VPFSALLVTCRRLYTIFSNVLLHIQRIAILGANGQGKTTLLNLVMGKLKPLRGSVSVNSGLRIGHFTQHSSDNFDLQLSAVENLLNMFENAEDLEIRTFLGKFQIQGDDALKPMLLLSGGQKSRVAFAALAFKKPHVLIIDEGTYLVTCAVLFEISRTTSSLGSNHLSMEAVDALIEAVQDFKGGILVVSHDQYFVSKVRLQDHRYVLLQQLTPVNRLAASFGSLTMARRQGFGTSFLWHHYALT
jgi:ATP-binding cassette, subfamily F, member 3